TRYRLGFHTEKRQSPQSAASEREGERNMGSREKDQPTPHLSSLVVRPTDSGGENGGGGAGSDYEPGEVRRDAPPYSRSDRFSDSHAEHFAWCKNFALEEGTWWGSGEKFCWGILNRKEYISSIIFYGLLHGL
ncbi:hypothetical protein AABB24_009541, partial [Solanum stoloniferum]